MEELLNGGTVQTVVDVMMKPRETGDKQKSLPAIIIEFKVFDPKREKTLEETAARALVQIGEKNYDAELIADGVRRDDIIHYGMVFRGKEALVKVGGEPTCK